MTDTVSCRQCGSKFTPAFRAGRNTGRGRAGRARVLADAQFCTARCKQANYRWRRSAVTPIAEKTRPGPEVRSAVTSPLQHTETTSEILTKNEGARPLRIVPDATYPGMYRIRRPDGSLSDMVNLTRARDAIHCEAT
jgi:DTW domain-containing protein YfiP